MKDYSIIRNPGRVKQDLASRVKALRKQRGFSQAELAKRTGVSLGSIRRFEQSGEISLSNLLMIGYLLGRLTEFDELMKPIEDLKEIEKMIKSGK